MAGRHASVSDDVLRERFDAIIRADAGLMALLAVLRDLRLPQGRLVAGCLYQAVWNQLTGRPPRTGIRDYDVIYFDEDLSWEAEDRVIRRFAAAATGCPGPVEVRNQARVHLWFEQRFGLPYPPLRSADESLGRYVSIVHAVGARLEDDGRLDIAAPFGLDDVFAMIMRPNPAAQDRESHRRKAERAREIWPEIQVEL